jgi:hypothetical protein
MKKEFLVGKITLESIKFLLERVAKEERITLRIMSSLSDITTIGMAFWLFFNITGEVLKVRKKNPRKKNLILKRKKKLKKRNLQFLKG